MNQQVNCQKHLSPYQYVQFSSPQSPFKCLQCEDLSFENPSQLLGFDDWVKRMSTAALEGVRAHKALVEVVGRQVWDHVSEVCRLPKYEDTAVAQKARLQDQIKQIKENLTIKIDALQQSIELQVQYIYIQNYIKQIDEQVVSLSESIRYCSRMIEETDICQQALPYSNPNNIYLCLQQANAVSTADIFQKMRQVDQTALASNDRRQLIQQFRAVAMKVHEKVDYAGSFVESLGNRLIEEINKSHIHQRSKSSEKRSISPILGKENSYTSNTLKVLAIAEANGGGSVTPLSSNRTYLNKQNTLPNTLPNDNKYISPSKRTTPSPLRKIEKQISNELFTTSLQAMQGNKSLLLNQLAKAPRAHETTLKPLKKYQIDFPVATIEVITDSIFALTSCNDPFLRIFDTVMKRIHTLQAHNCPVIAIEKTHQIVKSNVSGTPQSIRNVSQKQYILSLSSDSFVVWVFDNSHLSSQIQPVPQIFFKLKCPDLVRHICYLQDGNCVAFGDSIGNISVYNFQSQKYQLNPIEKQHTKGIQCMSFIAKTKKMVVLGEDQKITLWKLNYSCYPRQQQLDSIKFEKVLYNLDLGNVRIIQPLYSEPDFLIIGNEEGNLRLVNLSSEKVEIESNNSLYQFPVVDINVAEEINTNENESSYCVMALNSQMKSLRLWRVQRQGKTFHHTESRVEIAMQLGENLSRSKLQYVQLSNNNYFVLIANENGKELLVYEVTSK